MNLNKEQLEAINLIEGPVAVYAGAGTGKTTVLIERIRNMLKKGINPHKILVVTFTNKATNQIKNRISDLEYEGISISTIHKFCVLLLRKYEKHLPFSKPFIIIDDADQEKIVKKLYEEVFDDKPSVIDKSEFIKSFDFLRVNPNRLPNEQAKQDYEKLLDKYRSYLLKNCYVDFTGLLEWTYKLLENEVILEKLEKHYEYLLVDEFQDTDLLQYKILREIFKKSRNFFLVGDEDQSIYSFRGANFGNLKMFQEDFPEHKKLVLTTNYRSDQVILDGANKLIKHNLDRYDKSLVSSVSFKNKCCLHIPFQSLSSNAKTVVSFIKGEAFKTNEYSNYCILARNSYILTPFEQEIIASSMPYNMYGGIKYYKRREIKDVFSIMRLAVGIYDELAFERALSILTTGIGPKTSHKLYSQNPGDLLEYIASDTCLVSQKIKNELLKFTKFINDITKLLEESKLKEVFSKLVDTLYGDIRETDFTEFTRLSTNIVAAFEKFLNLAKENKEASLVDIIRMAFDDILIDTENAEKPLDNAITLSTVHSIKGLEFDTVWVVGLNESIIPDKRAIEDCDIEEERRILYVAMTRAKRRLFLNSHMVSHSYDFLKIDSSSMFVEEIVSTQRPKKHEEKYKLGENFFDQQFGYGQIIAIDSDFLVVKFANGETVRFKKDLL